MSDYFNDLQKQVEKYKSKYPNRPKKCAVKLAWWNLKKAIKKGPNSNREDSFKSSDDFLRIAIAEGGGIGDSLFQITYIKEIRKLFSKPVMIDFYCRAVGAFQNTPFIDHCLPYDEKHLNRDRYDVYIVSRRFYIINKMNADKVKDYSKKFYDFCLDCRHLTDTILKGEYNDNLFNQYALLFGKNRLEQANINGLLDVDRHTPKFMDWPEEDNAILYAYGLDKNKYITLCRAVDSLYTNTHPKLWPLDYYNELIQKIKKAYPDIQIVQVGSNKAFGEMAGTDLNLVGKTTLNQSKVILKHSLLHIDGEGGLVHMKNALNGKSVVLFGPTNPTVFEYEDNINLRSDACPYFCEWITPNWTKACMKRHKRPPCMAHLTPDYVFKAVQNYLQKLPRWHTEIIKKETITPLKNKKIACVLRPNDDFKHQLIKGKNDITIYDTDLSLPESKNSRNCGYLHQCQKEHIACEYGSVYNIPAPNETYDVVYCDRLGEVKYPRLAVQEMIRILKENGVAILPVSPTEIIYMTKRKV